MSETELSKNVKLTPTAHSRLIDACRAKYGTEKIRFSDAILAMAEETIRRESDDE